MTEEVKEVIDEAMVEVMQELHEPVSVTIPLTGPGYVLVDTETGHTAAVNVYGEALTDMVGKAMDVNKEEPLELEPEYDPDKWYTPTTEYSERFYELGNFHYNPEDSEHARNPMFRNVREFQEQLKLEVKCQELYHEEYKRGALQSWHLQAEFRKERLQAALHALDEYYAGTVIDKDISTISE